MNSTEIFEEINQKYKNEEDILNETLNSLQKSLDKIQNEGNTYTQERIAEIPTQEEAVKRNKKIHKSLEMAKAHLRSRAIYNPAEATWCSTMQKYQDKPSLPVVSWQCCMGIYI